MRGVQSLKRLLSAGLTLSLLVGCGTSAPFATAGRNHLSAKGGSKGQLSLLTMPDAGAAPIIAAIQGAKKSIQLEMYMLTDHDVTDQIVQALIMQAKAGVNVQVLLDPHPFTGATPPGGNNPDVNSAAADALTQGGVQVKRTSTRFSYTHEKAMVIDGTTAYIMTLNLTNSAFTTNREYAVIDSNPADVSEVAAIFSADWQYQTYVPKDPNLVVSPDNSRQRILNLIDSAKKSLVLQSEFLTDPQVVAHLGARAKAGVAMQIMLSYLPKDPNSSNDPNGQETQLLQQQGITQIEFTQTLKMHAKSIVVDGTQAYVGSENFTTNSLDRNRELGILLTDPTVVSAIAATQAKDWAAK